MGSVVQLGRTLGCRYLQGYLLGRPVPPEQLRDVLEGFDAGRLDAASDLTDGHLAVH